MIKFSKFCKFTKKVVKPRISLISIKNIFNKADWGLLFGFAIFLSWLMLCVSMPDPVTYKDPFHDLRWLSLSVSAISSAFFVAYPKLLVPIARSRKSLIATALIASIGCLLGPISAYFESISVSVLISSAVIIGASFSIIMLIWFQALVKAKDRAALIIACSVAPIITHLFAALLFSTQTSPIIMILFLSFLPLISILFLVLKKRANTNKDATKEKPCNKAESAINLKDLKQHELKFLIRICICLLLVVFSLEVLREVYFERGAISFYVEPASLIPLFAELAIGLVFLAIFETQNNSLISTLVKVIFIALLVSVLSLPFLLKGYTFAYIILKLSTFSFQIIISVIIFEACCYFRSSLVVILGTARSAWAIAGLLGLTVGHLLPAPSQFLIHILTLILCMLIAISFVFVFTPEHFAKLLSVSNHKDASDDSSKWINFASEYGITERELEVAMLIVKGRTAKRIATLLGVSLSTANSHIYHIYQKTGVHSNQELIDLVED